MHPQSAVIFMEEDILSDTHKPLMLEEFLTVPILERMARKLWNEGMQRFFVVCTPQFAAPARVCFPEEAEAAELVPGWLPVYGTDTLAELEPWFREGRDGN